ncbi:hypothetical protein E0H26_03885 [Micromonospora zingiberis]|uniref:Translation initiation factor 2 n=1 Tax=Micromonospora zingiberis TaxID=2053011 RepID=A0A4V2LXA7_9ACTN|nr:hypothetical protein [Micromonospora zingiberis]TCB99705.1 hypothetical protein E0H26_03885 [Micromonospora zingiberis]
MTTSPPGPASDEPWRRPDTGDGATSGDPAQRHPAPGGGGPGQPPAAGASDGYPGPPPTIAPPAGWRPPVHLQALPPRQLPAQDMAALDAREQRAQRLTWGVGAVAGAVLMVLVCLLCTRALF